MFVPLSHDTFHIGVQKQALHADLYLSDVLHLDDTLDLHLRITDKIERINL
ncbi:hypothetical protein M070_4334 [Bacteroides fragilis str. A7 (UDC12-2)]|nr:hypothetical protein M070_4334 [Bacteroides fragilis str. A7 (UDC12-2)]